MGFGDCVSSLLETYSRCLELLNVFHRRSGSDNSSDASSILQRSIRSDRSKVRQAYANQLGTKGNRLEKGDGQSRSALRRILRRLNAAITKLLHGPKSYDSVLDVEALMLLSNSSRAEAVTAIDQLSQRLGSSPSQRSLATAPSSSSSSCRRGGPSVARASLPPSISPSKSSHRRSRKQHSSDVGNDHRRRVEPKGGGRASPTGHRGGGGGGTDSQHHPRHGHGHGRRDRAVPERDSLLSMSSDSTKLGEVRPRSSRRRRQEFDSSSEDYSVRPTYPLKPHAVPRQQRGGFLSLFRR